MAQFLDKTGLSYLWSKAIAAFAPISHVHSDYVSKVTGMGLSTNNYTTAEKEKLSGISENANNYSHPSTHDLSMITDNNSDNVFSGDHKINKIMYFKNNSITNANTLWKSGYYGTTNTCIGTPYSAYWYMVVMNKDSTNQISIQWAIPVTKANNGEIWVRIVRLNASTTGDGNYIGTWERLINQSYLNQLLDGFAPSGYGLGTNATDISDGNIIDTIRTEHSGWYMGSGVTNSPSPGWYYYEVITRVQSYALVNAYSAVDVNLQYTGILNNNVWSGWHLRYNSGNINTVTWGDLGS